MTEAQTAAGFDALALVATVCLGLLLGLHDLAPAKNLVEAPRPRQIALSLIEQPPPPPPPPAAPAAPALPPPPLPPLPTRPSPLPRSPLPKARPIQPRQPTPPATQPAVPAPPAPPTAADAAPVPPREAPENHSAEAQFVSQVRARIQRNTHPPDSAAYRLTHPSGEAYIGFMLSRAGMVSGVRVLRSSGSPLIDRQGIAIVSGLDFPPMPADVYPGEAAHPFSVPIDIDWAGGDDL